jgi:hypothetical protein
MGEQGETLLVVSQRSDAQEVKSQNLVSICQGLPVVWARCGLEYQILYPLDLVSSNLFEW